MVAALEAPNKKPISRKKLAFAQAVALGSTLSSAYRQVFSPTCARGTAEAQGCRLGLELRSEILRLKAESWSIDAMGMQERRSLLGKIARRGSAAEPTAADSIRAIAEDATLAGERRQDESQANVGVVIDMTQVLAALAGAIVGGSAVQGSITPQRAEPVFDLVGAPVATSLDEASALAPAVTEISASQEMASTGVDPVGAADVWADE